MVRFWSHEGMSREGATMATTELVAEFRTAEREVESVGAMSAPNDAGETRPIGAPLAAAEPARFLVLRAPVAMSYPASVEVFATEDEARKAFSVWIGSASSLGHWGEVARVGGGSRPAVVVWAGRPFPPVSEGDLDVFI